MKTRGAGLKLKRFGKALITSILGYSTILPYNSIKNSDISLLRLLSKGLLSHFSGVYTDFPYSVCKSSKSYVKHVSIYSIQ